MAICEPIEYIREIHMGFRSKKEVKKEGRTSEQQAEDEADRLRSESFDYTTFKRVTITAIIGWTIESMVPLSGSRKYAGVWKQLCLEYDLPHLMYSDDLRVWTLAKPSGEQRILFYYHIWGSEVQMYLVPDHLIHSVQQPIHSPMMSSELIRIYQKLAALKCPTENVFHYYLTAFMEDEKNQRLAFNARAMEANKTWDSGSIDKTPYICEFKESFIKWKITREPLLVQLALQRSKEGVFSSSSSSLSSRHDWPHTRLPSDKCVSAEEIRTSSETKEEKKNHHIADTTPSGKCDNAVKEMVPVLIKSKEEMKNADLRLADYIKARDFYFRATTGEAPVRRGDRKTCQQRLLRYLDTIIKDTYLDFRCVCTLGVLNGRTILVHVNKQRELTYIVCGPFQNTRDIATIGNYLTSEIQQSKVVSTMPHLEIHVHADLTTITKSIATVLHDNTTRMGFVNVDFLLSRGSLTLLQMRTLVDPSVTLFIGPAENLQTEEISAYRLDGIEIGIE